MAATIENTFEITYRDEFGGSYRTDVTLATLYQDVFDFAVGSMIETYFKDMLEPVFTKDFTLKYDGKTLIPELGKFPVYLLIKIGIFPYHNGIIQIIFNKTSPAYEILVGKLNAEQLEINRQAQTARQSSVVNDDHPHSVFIKNLTGRTSTLYLSYNNTIGEVEDMARDLVNPGLYPHVVYAGNDLTAYPINTRLGDIPILDLTDNKLIVVGRANR